MLYSYSGFAYNGSTVSISLRFFNFLIHCFRAAIVLSFINYQLYYESITNKDVSIGMAPQLEQSYKEFQVGITEVVDVSLFL